MADRQPAALRKISFPPEALFQSAIQDGDNLEIWRLLNSSAGRQMDVDTSNHAGLTALHQSVLNDNLDGVKILLCRGADVSKADINGFTPLHTASACGFLQISSLLLLFGANSFALTSDGDLPVDLATDNSIITLLTSEMVHDIQRKHYWHHLFFYYARECFYMFLRMLTFGVGYIFALFSQNAESGPQEASSSTPKQRRTGQYKRPDGLGREKTE